jgi:hypothetical protein
MIHNWLKEVRDLLRDTLVDTDVTDRSRNILVMPDGQPSAISGDMFIAVHSGGIMSGGELFGSAYRESYVVLCTVTTRTRNSPEDRDGDEIFLAASKSLSKVARKVSSIVSNSVLLLESVRTAVVDEDASAGVVEPLFFSSTSSPTPRYKDWFYSVDSRDDDRQPSGYSLEVAFSGGAIITKVAC